MNNVNRRELAKAIDLIDQAATIVADVLADEQEKYDNTPENLEGSERYERLGEIVDQLEECEGDFDDLKNRLEEAAE